METGYKAALYAYLAFAMFVAYAGYEIYGYAKHLDESIRTDFNQYK